MCINDSKTARHGQEEKPANPINMGLQASRPQETGVGALRVLPYIEAGEPVKQRPEPSEGVLCTEPLSGARHYFIFPKLRQVLEKAKPAEYLTEQHFIGNSYFIDRKKKKDCLVRWTVKLEPVSELNLETLEKHSGLIDELDLVIIESFFSFYRRGELEPRLITVYREILGDRADGTSRRPRTDSQDLQELSERIAYLESLRLQVDLRGAVEGWRTAPPGGWESVSLTRDSHALELERKRDGLGERFVIQEAPLIAELAEHFNRVDSVPVEARNLDKNRLTLSQALTRDWVLRDKVRLFKFNTHRNKKRTKNKQPLYTNEIALKDIRRELGTSRKTRKNRSALELGRDVLNACKNTGIINNYTEIKDLKRGGGEVKSFRVEMKKR